MRDLKAVMAAVSPPRPQVPLTQADLPLMRTELFAYQLRSVGRMLERERGERERDRGREQRAMAGGILCEDMGTGKTAICIALITKTRGEMTRPPASKRRVLLDGRGDMTRMEAELTRPARQEVPSLAVLAAMAARRFGLHRHQLDPNAEARIPDVMLQQIQQLPHPYFPAGGIGGSRTSSGRTTQSTVSSSNNNSNLYLSWATLIVVPATLVNQWLGEFRKHSLDNALVVHVVRNSAELARSSPQMLAQADVVITTHGIFGQEDRLESVSSLRVSNLVCQCPYVGNTRMRVCTCIRSSYTSPLARVHWKRIIVDEGHVMATKSNRFHFGTHKLSTESRWVTTGTPLVLDDIEGDLERLLNMYTFLNMSTEDKETVLYSQFSRVQRAIDAARTDDALEAARAQQQTLVDRLFDVLDRIAVRHPRAEIEQDRPLPSCSIHDVFFELMHHELVRYNVRVALVKANILMSEGEGVDSYMHARNRKFALLALDQIKESCFHCAPLPKSEVVAAINNVRQWLYKAHRKDWQVAEANLILQHLLADDRIVLGQDAPELTAVGYILATPNAVDSGSEQSFHEHADMARKSVVRVLNGIIDHKVQMRKLKRPEYPEPGVILPVDDRTLLVDGDAARYIQQASHNHTALRTRDFDVRLWDSVTLEETTSSKLNHILKRICVDAPNDKAIIFTQFNNVHVFISEVLELAGIKHLQFHTKLSPTVRAQTITTFNTSSVRVIIMTTELAAFGINLTAANRIFIMEPIDDPAMEAQAIKRAHRIGQTRAVVVEKLYATKSIEAPLRTEATDEEGDDEGDYDVGGSSSSAPAPPPARAAHVATPANYSQLSVIGLTKAKHKDRGVTITQSLQHLQYLARTKAARHVSGQRHPFCSPFASAASRSNNDDVVDDIADPTGNVLILPTAPKVLAVPGSLPSPPPSPLKRKQAPKGPVDEASDEKEKKKVRIADPDTGNDPHLILPSKLKKRKSNT